jgi:hypothetical protein
MASTSKNITPNRRNIYRMEIRRFSAVLCLPVVIGILASAPAAGQVPAPDVAKPASAAWAQPLLDGQPDVQGMWIAVNDSVFTLTPAVEDDNLPSANAQPRANRPRRDPSRVLEPNHQIPYQVWAKEKQLDIQAHKDHATEEKYVDPQVRCLPSPIRGAFWQDFQILQYPGYVVFEYEGNHVFRIMPLDGRPHASSSIKLWMGDSRAHWEGTTLVVDLTNYNGKGRLSREGDFASENLHVTERYTFVDGKTMKYEATFDDPTVYTRPWKIAGDFMPKRTDPGYEQWEEACHEGEHDADLFVSKE